MTAVDRGAVASQVRHAGYCTHPIRLRGHLDGVDPQTGEMRTIVDSSDAPGGALLVSCRNRRATVCPACSETYRGDAWQLIAAGLRGGKGVPDVVATNPRVFATFTAPSFGAVHSRRGVAGRVRTCRPRRAGSCAHGRERGCRFKHAADDPALGQPICHECFRYDEAVLWNAHAGALWSRTVIGLRRSLAREAGVSVRGLADLARVSFIKVIEYQARGVVHVHAVVRLDGPDEHLPAPAHPDRGALVDSIRLAARSTSVPFLLPDGNFTRSRWGEQLDVRPLAADGPQIGGVAAYIAKYATKSTDAVGALDHRIRRRTEIERLAVNPHLRRLVQTAWELGGEPRYQRLRLRAWAHTLGYRGHWTTKSRRYSTTFTALRSARMEHAAESSDAAPELRIGQWAYAGRGYRLPDEIGD